MSCKNCIHSVLQVWTTANVEVRCDNLRSPAYRRKVSPTWSCNRFSSDCNGAVHDELKLPATGSFAGSHAR